MVCCVKALETGFTDSPGVVRNRGYPFCCRSVDPPSIVNLRLLDQQKFLLTSCEQGLHAFQPITFSVPNLALCNVSVHTCTLQQSNQQATIRYC